MTPNTNTPEQSAIPEATKRELEKIIYDILKEDIELVGKGRGTIVGHASASEKVAIAMYQKMQEIIQMYVDVADASLTTIDKVRGELSTANATIETLKQQLFSRTDEDARLTSIVTAELNAANAQIEALQKAHEQLKQDAAFRLDAIFARQKEIEILKEELAQARVKIQEQQDWHDSLMGGTAI